MGLILPVTFDFLIFFSSTIGRTTEDTDLVEHRHHFLVDRRLKTKVTNELSKKSDDKHEDKQTDRQAGQTYNLPVNFENFMGEGQHKNVQIYSFFLS